MRDKIMEQNTYDVSIIGSGMGGLCAGALLAHRGYKTLVVESTGRLGGRCSTQKAEGFQLVTGAVALHRGGAIDKVYKEVGAEPDLIDMPKQWYRISSIEGRNHDMPAKGAIAALLDITNNMEISRARLLGQMAKEVAVGKVLGLFARGMQGQEKANGITFREWLLKYTENELAHKTFDAMCANLMNFHTHEVKASDLFSVFGNLNKFRNVGIAPKGNEANMELLAKVIRANGDVWTDCPAARILIKNGKAEGIVVQKNGRKCEVKSRVVISNAGPRRTVSIAGEANFNRQYLDLMNRIYPVGMILAHVVSDQPLCLADGELGGMLLIGLRRLTAAFPLSNFSPNLAPAGKHLLYLVGLPLSYLKPVDPGEELKQITLDLKDQFPGFERSGEIIQFEVVMQELPEPGTHIPCETPVQNLYNVGDCVYSPGLAGASSAAESARYVAGKIKKETDRL